MLRNVKLCRYSVPTPIQRYCIPAIKSGYDVIAIAQTGKSRNPCSLTLARSYTNTGRPGSGKTAAYLIPVLDKLIGKVKTLAAARPNPATYRPGIDPTARAEPLVVIVCPIRELAIQIFNEARKFCYRSMLRPCVAYGGGPLRGQIEQLQKGCDVLVASPGRLIDFIERPSVLSLRRLRYMVIDESDEMLHDDWNEDFTKILSGGGMYSILERFYWRPSANKQEQNRKRVMSSICSFRRPFPRPSVTWQRLTWRSLMSGFESAVLVAHMRTSSKTSSTWILP